MKITDQAMATLCTYMSDNIREDLHSRLSPCSNEDFIAAYARVDNEFAFLLNTELSQLVNDEDDEEDES